MFDITKSKKIFVTIAAVLVLVSIASIIFQGFNLDTDFAGGMAVTYQISEEFDAAEVRDIVDKALGNDQNPSSVQKSGDEVVIKFGFDNALQTDEERSDFSMGKIEAITLALEARYGKAEVAEEVAPAEEAEGEAVEAEAQEEETVEATGVILKSQDVVSPSTGRDLAKSAIWMSIIACLAILLYVTFRFEFTSGVVAIIALVHDVVLLMGIYSVFQISVNTNFIAAILTVLGYSINNTIVIMDRIRENTRHARKETYGEIANNSIWQTMNRSINTTITTLLTIGMVYILGVPSIQEFSLPIIIGIVIGFYSSVFVSGPIWAAWRDSSVKGKRA